MAFIPYKGQPTSHSSFYLECKPDIGQGLCSRTGSELPALYALLNESSKSQLNFWAPNTLFSVRSCFKERRESRCCAQLYLPNSPRLWAFKSSLSEKLQTHVFLEIILLNFASSFQQQRLYKQPILLLPKAELWFDTTLNLQIRVE